MEIASSNMNSCNVHMYIYNGNASVLEICNWVTISTQGSKCVLLLRILRIVFYWQTSLTCLCLEKITMKMNCRYLNTIQTMCPHILRYLTTAVITNKRRKAVLKDLVKVIQQVIATLWWCCRIFVSASNSFSSRLLYSEWHKCTFCRSRTHTAIQSLSFLSVCTSTLTSTVHRKSCLNVKR